MSIQRWEVLYDYKRSTIDNTTTESNLYEQDWHAIKLYTDRIMTKFEVENTPEWAAILMAREDHTKIFQQPENSERYYSMQVTTVTPDLIVRLQTVLNEMGIDVKGLNEAAALLQQNQGNMAALTTAVKTSLVGSINSLKQQFDSIDLTALIDDENASASTVYSSQKVAGMIQTAIDGVISGAPGTRDTLNELSAAIDGNKDIIDLINAALNGAVRFDVAQNRSEEEKAQARANIGGAAEADLVRLAGNVGDIASLELTDYTNARDGVVPE